MKRIFLNSVFSYQYLFNLKIMSEFRMVLLKNRNGQDLPLSKLGTWKYAVKVISLYRSGDL